MKRDAILLLLFSLLWIQQTVLGLPQPAPVNEYPIHADGGIVYDPLRREAEKTGQLTRYTDAITSRHELKLDPYLLTFSVPDKALAYDIVPIRYQITWDKDAESAPLSFPLAVEAVAFEDRTRSKNQNLFDLSLPGKIDLDVEYLGSVTAHLIPKSRHYLTADFSDKPHDVYPNMKREAMVRSGTVEAGEHIWFRFRSTNTGNTILDPEGFGASIFHPQLLKKQDDGTYTVVAEGARGNLYVRDLEYHYPGEAHETWLTFSPQPQEPGEYKIRFRMIYRSYKTLDSDLACTQTRGKGIWLNLWGGPPAFVWEMPIRIEEEPRQTPVEPGEKVFTDGGDPDKITRFIHTFEEFMTAFDCHQAQPNDERNSISGTLYLQVAPWTEHITVKLIGTDPVAITTKAVPINIDSDSLEVVFNADHPACFIKDGLRQPVVAAQHMIDMRTNLNVGPYPEIDIPRQIEEMTECGVNLFVPTAMPFYYFDESKGEDNCNADAGKYFLDLARQQGLQIEGWGHLYHNGGPDLSQAASWVTGDRFQIPYSVPNSHPRLAAANAAVWLYNFHRWGDLFYQTHLGQVPIGVEDVGGWMRQDINIRYGMDKLTIRAFVDWLKQKYGTIDRVNQTWSSQLSSFDQIDPEKSTTDNPLYGKHEFTDRSQLFHDWNQAMADLDEFRTQLRLKCYRESLDIVRKEIPNATISLRTDGAIVLVSGIDPEDPNPHFRHIYYSQRRCGAIAELIQQSGLVTFHADYTKLAYAPSEIRHLVRESVRQGIVPVYLAQFDHQSDIAINDKFGSEYQVHYNLPEPKKGYMMQVLTALYPWYKAMYEEGGVPGILWEDIQVDGVATATQKREMRFFDKKLAEAINTPQALQARKVDRNIPSQDWRKGSRRMPSYQLEKILSKP